MEAARTCALGLIKFRPRSESEVKIRLARGGFPEELIRQVLEEFRGKGLLDDAKFSRYFAESRMVAKPVSQRQLFRDLKAKGIEGSMAADAVGQAVGGQSEVEVARRVALERLSQMRGVAPLAVKRRLFGFLSRRGFGSEVVYQVMREVVENKGRSFDAPAGQNPRSC